MCPKKTEILSDAQRSSSFRVWDHGLEQPPLVTVYTVWCNHLSLFEIGPVLVSLDHVARLHLDELVASDFYSGAVCLDRIDGAGPPQIQNQAPHDRSP